MPRSFLVKKVKLDTFSSADLESSYGRARSDLGVRLHEKGASWAEAGDSKGPRAMLEGVEDQSMEMERSGAPGNRRKGTRTRRRQWLKLDCGGRWGEGNAKAGQNRAKARQGECQCRRWGARVGNRKYLKVHTDPHPGYAYGHLLI